jgi:hypothetical protein
MRGSKVQGRFKIEFENRSINEGVVDELRDPVGDEVDWWIWDSSELEGNYEDWVDDIYDTSSQTPGGGRRWNDPLTMPVIMAQLLRGGNVMNERGFYVTDTLRLTVGEEDALRLIPDLLENPTDHIKDRIIYQNRVFTPRQVMPRGRYKEQYAVISIDCVMVNSEELVNDPQFQSFAE